MGTGAVLKSPSRTGSLSVFSILLLTPTLKPAAIGVTDNVIDSGLDNGLLGCKRSRARGRTLRLRLFFLSPLLGGAAGTGAGVDSAYPVEKRKGVRVGKNGEQALVTNSRASGEMSNVIRRS